VLHTLHASHINAAFKQTRMDTVTGQLLFLVTSGEQNIHVYNTHHNSSCTTTTTKQTTNQPTTCHW